MSQIIALLLLAGTLLGVEEPQNAPAPTTFDNEILDSEQQEFVDYALERFEIAGLVLPADLTIRFPADEGECFGYGGLYVPTEVEVRICRPSDTTIVHELAHAWVETTLSAAEREAFLELRELDTWIKGAEWDQRGAEQAAEIITWAIMDRDIMVRWLEPGPVGTSIEIFRLFKIDNSTHDELVAAYQLLTGTIPAERQLQKPSSVTDTDIASPEARRN